MLPKKLLQTTLDVVKEVNSIDLCIITEDGEVCAKTFLPDNMIITKSGEFLKSGEDSRRCADSYFCAVNTMNGEKYIVVAICDSDDKVYVVKTCSLYISQLINTYCDEMESDMFMRNLLNGSDRRNEISRLCSLYNYNKETKRTVALISTNKMYSYDILNYVRENTSDVPWINAVYESEDRIAVITETSRINLLYELYKNIKNKFNGHVIRMTVGGTADGVFEIKRSFKEANITDNVAREFYSDTEIVEFEDVGFERLIFEIPIGSCAQFLEKNRMKNSFEELDRDITDTIDFFFDNNLNISETARKMYIHRNTLIYRLNKAYNLTGLDVRKFEDAVNYKMFTMLYKRLKNEGEDN